MMAEMPMPRTVVMMPATHSMASLARMMLPVVRFRTRYATAKDKAKPESAEDTSSCVMISHAQGCLQACRYSVKFAQYPACNRLHAVRLMLSARRCQVHQRQC
jgi:hypothetical protein